MSATQKEKYPKTITVHITKDDIAEARAHRRKGLLYEAEKHCPIGCALRRQLPKTESAVRVRYTNATIYDATIYDATIYDGMDAYNYQLSKTAQKIVSEWDNNHIAKPQTIRLRRA